ncbi:type VI secretion system tip protein VgrG [Variovorax sp. KBW07]|uniref:type VI secretion system Vgr family protein n=1 Tax=Variovorax sp. KBW07 TaxID=2153358 RepID=UPI000F566345|nr:type VI secretion system tip protein VgrG [Variovorax sp. KBW07]RQO44134.1 type VI secretion system tip protein VgrG [Variovorax sp. KBW07]
MPRTVLVHTVLSAEQLKFRAMRGQEGLSQLFEFEVDMVSTSFNLDLKTLLGTSLTIELADEGAARFLNGTVVRFELVGRANETGRHYVYRALVQPWLWYLTRTTDCRIFQNKSVPEVLDEVLGKYGFDFEKRLTGSYRAWEYCVQYQESDFAFVCRLMEHEGIGYHFEHSNGSHRLVLADDSGSYRTLPGHATIPYRPRDRMVNAIEPCIDRWRVSEQITSGRVMLDDFDFKKSRASLQSVQQDPKKHDYANYEVYEWMGGYSEHQQGDSYAKIRLQELQCAHELASGHTNVTGMAPGYLFAMTHCPREADNREYLVTETRYDLQEPEYSTGGSSESVCEFDFSVLPSSVPYRPRRKTPKPRTNGPQTATVVGPEEIWTDKFGRVKLQFRWDRYGQANENSSCWVRVSSHWAGSGFGGVHLPRIGQEVVVDFIGGEPDRPLVIGSVYNNDQMPPWDLPGSASQSGLLSRSVAGTTETANALRFEDKPGAEQIWLHAEKNLDTEVEANETRHVGGSRTTTIVGNETLDVTGTRTTTITKKETATYNGGEERLVNSGGVETINGGQTRTVNGGETETINNGETRTVNGGRTEIVNGGETRTVNGGETETIKGGETRDVHGATNWTHTGPVTTTINGVEKSTTNGPRTDVVTGGETRNITGTQTENVSVAIVVNAPNVTYNVEKHIVHATNQDYWRKNVSYGTNTRHNVVITSFDLWGARVQAYAGLNMQIATAKIDIAIFKNADTGLAMKRSAFRFSQAGADIKSGVLALSNKVMSIFN